jgi:quercetin dioxygenase-like cupin family protein
MSEREPATARVVENAPPLWFLGTLARVLLDAETTGGRLGMIDLTLPKGAAPPLHSHPQDETFYVLDGEVTMSVGDERRRCGVGAIAYAPGGAVHGWRVESDTARMLILSTPAGIEAYFRELGEPAAWPWLQPPPDGPRVSPERLAEVERRFGVVRHGPLPSDPA